MLLFSGRTCSLPVFTAVVFLLFSLATVQARSFDTLFGHARVLDGDTLSLKGKKIRLHGIDAPEKAQRCITAGGAEWACGKSAKKLMLAMTEGREVYCRLDKKDGFGRWIGRCFVGSKNLNREMVIRGMAWAFRKYSHDFVSAEKIARQERRGIWDGRNQTARDFRARRWDVAAAQVSPNGCAIKGNISRKKARIYHLPWFHSYMRTRIDVASGERWFCSEKEAVQAGWRRAYTR